MSCRTALLWDEKIMFSRFLNECGVLCEHITPQLLAAPFFRGSFVAMVIPTGFANPSYSRLLPALRASSGRMRRYLEGGGRLLAFGAGIDRPDAYDWLPSPLVYTHMHRAGPLECVTPHSCAALFSEYDPSLIECDGFFSECEGDVIATMEGRAVLVRFQIGKGEAVVTTIHEYPSRIFLKEYCTSPSETLF